MTASYCQPTSWATIQTHNFEGLRNHHSLFLVVGWQDPFKRLEAGSLASLAPLGQHGSHSLPKDARGAWKVVRAPRWGGVHPLTKEGQVLQLVSVKIA